MIDDKMTNTPIIRKFRTRIDGLDRLLYGGLDLQSPLTVITVEGEDEVERSMLGLQILYGVGQSLYEAESKNDENKSACTPIRIHHVSRFSDSVRAEKLLADVIISSSVHQLMKMYVSIPAPKRDNITNVMSRLFFDVDSEDSLIGSNRAYDEIANNRLVNMVRERTDYLLGKEVLYYSNRTGGIHLRSAKFSPDIKADSDSENLLFVRKNLRDIFSEKHSERKSAQNEKITRYNDFFPNPLIKIEFGDWGEVVHTASCLSDNTSHSLMAIDMSECNCADETELCEVIKALQASGKACGNGRNNRARLLVLTLPKSAGETVSDHFVDMRIEMKSIWEERYQFKYMSIAKSRRQNRVLGQHQYKQKDYGIEIYPNVHTYYEQRRYLQRALVFTHSNVITDTYQQYIDEKQYKKSEKIGYRLYTEGKDKQAQKVFSDLYTKYDYGISSVDVLDRILLSQPRSNSIYSNALDEPLSYLGCVTAVVGDPNTYKRFLTFGSIFSSSLNKEHTLVLLMNKDYMTSRRHLFCPARAEHAADEPRCLKCYEYIHFMNMSMGNITPEEFIYYLNYQLDTCYDDGGKIKRVIIDDLQIVDFCFPKLSRCESMFLPTLVSVCKERGIWLYVMCDKTCKSVDALRALSDNVICTDKGKDGQLIVHIERYVGYHNTPSMIRSCHVKKARQLFECYEKMDDDDNPVCFFELNSQQIISKSERTLGQYWNNSCKL